MINVVLFLKDSNPSQSRRHSARAEEVYHSVYEKGPVVPGAGVRTQHFFIAVSSLELCVVVVDEDLLLKEVCWVSLNIFFGRRIILYSMV